MLPKSFPLKCTVYEPEEDEFPFSHIICHKSTNVEKVSFLSLIPDLFFLSLSVPDTPTDLRALNVTDSTALLLWRGALAAINKYAIVYGSGTGEEMDFWSVHYKN